MNLRNNNDLEQGAIAAIAAASKTPFRTAFKIQAGLIAAQMTAAIVFFGTLVAIGVFFYHILK